MIRMIQSKSAGHAKAYFSDALSRSDYYVTDQELAGRWQGRLADRLGLEGTTAKEAFFALCENRHPQTGEHLTPRTKEDRTTGYDINFHCPKSVSVLHILANDDHILNAFQESVTETMMLIESDSQTRVRMDGKYEDRKSGELAWAHFVHQTARPVEGFSPDPHLHSHCFVFNAAWDETEQRIKAGQFRDIKRDMPYYQAHFHKTLSDKMIELGYQVKRTNKSFEIEGVPESVIGLFSKRTDEIGRFAKEKGITDAKQLGELGARTRSKKQKGASMKELAQEWRDQIKELGDIGKSDKIIRYAERKETGLTPEQCVDHAILHCFERASVMHDRRLLETAYRHSIGNQKVSVGDIESKFKNDKRIIHVREKTRTVCTTREVLNEEKHMVELARQGQGKMIPLYKEAPELVLSSQQAEAVRHILTTPHRVSIIRGAAGTGKTTLMREAIEKIKATGKQVTVLAPSAQASRGVLKEEGFAEAETVAKFLADPKMQQQIKGQVLWVDEAGLLGTRDMISLLDITTKQNARLILGGDTRQHASVIRGDALRILNTVAGIRTAEVSKIYRQKNEQYRDAVQQLSKGNVADSFRKLDEMNAIKAIDPLKPNSDLVKDYVETVKAGKSALIISPTHKQGEEVTKEVRKQLREEKLIGRKEITVRQLVNLNFTEAQKKDSRNFAQGQIIQFSQNAPGFNRGSGWQVESVKEKSVYVTNNDGSSKKLPFHQCNSYDVFAEVEMPLSKGDKIRITRNAFDENKKRLNNGQMLEVESVSKNGKFILQNKTGSRFNLDNDFGHIAHAHCITSHASQGKTVDEVFISQPAATFPATDSKQFYVSVSRGRDRAHIYTDDKEALLHHAKEMADRKSALELVAKSTKQIDIIHHIQRQEHLKTLARTAHSKQKQRESYEPEI